MARNSNNKPAVTEEDSSPETDTVKENTEMSELPEFLSNNSDAATTPPFGGVPDFLQGNANPFAGSNLGASAGVDFDAEYEAFDISHLQGEVTDPFAPIPAGFYRFRVGAAKPRKNQETGKIDVEVTLSIADGEQASRSVKKWLSLPSKNDGRTEEEKNQVRKFTRYYLTIFGLNEAEIMQFTPGTSSRMLIGREFYAQTIVKEQRDRDGKVIPGKFMADIAKFYSMEDYNKNMSQLGQVGGSANTTF